MTSPARDMPDLSSLANAYRELVPTVAPFHRGRGHDLLVFPLISDGRTYQEHRMALMHLIADETFSSFRLLDGLPTGKPVAIATVITSAPGDATGEYRSGHETPDGTAPC